MPAQRCLPGPLAVVLPHPGGGWRSGDPGGSGFPSRFQSSGSVVRLGPAGSRPRPRGEAPRTLRWLFSCPEPSHLIATASFANLSPRQPLPSTPYAVRAASAATAANGGVGTAALQTGAVSASSIADGTITAADLSPAVATNTFWRLTGNAVTAPGKHFLGTADHQALELRGNHSRILRLESTATRPTPIGGAAGQRQEQPQRFSGHTASAALSPLQTMALPSASDLNKPPQISQKQAP